LLDSNKAFILLLLFDLLLYSAGKSSISILTQHTTKSSGDMVMEFSINMNLWLTVQSSGC